MKRRRLFPQLSEEQQLILGLVLVILLAISTLYCLGFASVVLRQAWENAPLPWEDTSGTVEATAVPSISTTGPPGSGTPSP